jgi:hypothetical protein
MEEFLIIIYWYSTQVKTCNIAHLYMEVLDLGYIDFSP